MFSWLVSSFWKIGNGISQSSWWHWIMSTKYHGSVCIWIQIQHSGKHVSEYYLIKNAKQIKHSLYLVQNLLSNPKSTGHGQISKGKFASYKIITSAKEIITAPAMTSYLSVIGYLASTLLSLFNDQIACGNVLSAWFKIAFLLKFCNERWAAWCLFYV